MSSACIITKAREFCECMSIVWVYVYIDSWYSSCIFPTNCSKLSFPWQYGHVWISVDGTENGVFLDACKPMYIYINPEFVNCWKGSDLSDM